MCRRPENTTSRSGSAVPELAILLPFLLFSGLITTDFARVFQNLVTITDCAGREPFSRRTPATPRPPTTNRRARPLWRGRAG